MKRTYRFFAPLRQLHGGMLRGMMEGMGATVDDLAKVFQVNERTVRRWLANDDAPRAVLMALWHETHEGRHNHAVEMGNQLMWASGLARGLELELSKAQAQMGRLMAIGDFGSANDPVLSSKIPPPGGGPRGFMPGPRYPARVLRSFARRRSLSF